MKPRDPVSSSQPFHLRTPSDAPAAQRRSRAGGGTGSVLLAALFIAFFAGRSRAQVFVEIASGLPAPPNPCAVWGDYDGDGDLDLLVAGQGKHDIAFTTLYKNVGGVFTDSGIALLGLSRATAAFGDFDGDGDLDLAMTGLETNGAPTGPTRVRIYRNDGGTFTLVPGSFLGEFAGSVAWGDYDGDGDLDLLVTGVTTAAAGGVAATRLYRNDGGAFSAATQPFPDCYLGGLAWGDYDNDGDLDVVLTGTSGTGGLTGVLWRNDGDTFADAGSGLPGMDIGFTTWGDFDNDGDLDLLFGGDAFTSDGHVTRLYRNDGGTLTDASAGLLGLLWSSGAWGDYDNDGDLDAMVMGYDAVASAQRTLLYRNDAGLFVDSGELFHDLFLGTLSWADYDNDGDLDLLTAGNNGGADLLRIFRNDTATPNAAPSPPGNPTVSVAGTTARFSWDPASDDHTPAPGLSYNLRVGTTPGGSEIVSPQSGANGYRRLPEMGNVQTGLTARVGSLVPGTTYYWSVQSVDGAFVGSAFAPEGSFDVPVAGVGGHGVAGIPALRAAPNPFTRNTTLGFAAARAGDARIRVFDVRGRLVRTLVPGRLDGAEGSIRWDGRDETGRAMPAGLYLCRLESDAGNAMRRLVKLQ